MTSQKQSQLTNQILHGNLVQLMFKLTAPSIAGSLVLGLTPFIDALFAGQFLGKTAIGGITLALPFISLMGGLTDLIGIGSASLLSRAIGSGDIKTQSKIFGNLVVMSVVISFILTIIGYSFAEEFIVFMGGRGEVAFAGAQFLKTYVLGSVFFVLGIACNDLIKSEGKLRISMIFTIIFFSTNLIFNTVFVSVFHWGIMGLALATVIAKAAYCTGLLLYYFSGKSLIKVDYKKIIVAIDLLPEILSVGSSNLIMPAIAFIQSFVVFQLISRHGTQNDIAFFGATVTLNSLAYIPLGGFLQSFQPVIGINYGAKNYDRIKKAYLIFVICATVLLTFFWVCIQLEPEKFLGLILPDIAFNTNDLINFHLLSLLIPIMGFVPFSAVLFQSIGQGKIVSIIVLLKGLFIYIPIVFLLGQQMGIRGIYFGIITTDLLVLLIALILTFRKFQYFKKILVNSSY
ncbi:MAG: MATE family efflux transporter [Nostoc sp.]